MARSTRRGLLFVALAYLSIMAGAARAGGISFVPLNVPGATDTSAFGVNNFDQVVGVYLVGDEEHGFVYKTRFDFPFDFPGAVETALLGVNNNQQFVGAYTTTVTGQPNGLLLQRNNCSTINFPDPNTTSRGIQ